MHNIVMYSGPLGMKKDEEPGYMPTWLTISYSQHIENRRVDTQRMVHFRYVLAAVFREVVSSLAALCRRWEPPLSRHCVANIGIPGQQNWEHDESRFDMRTVAVWYVSKGLLYCCIGEVRFKLSTPNFVTFQPVRKTRFTCRKTLSHIPHQSTDTLTCTAPVLLHCLIATD